MEDVLTANLKIFIFIAAAYAKLQQIQPSLKQNDQPATQRDPPAGHQWTHADNNYPDTSGRAVTDVVMTASSG